MKMRALLVLSAICFVVSPVLADEVDDSSALQDDAAKAIGVIGGAQAETVMLAELRGDSPVKGSAAAKGHLASHRRAGEIRQHGDRDKIPELGQQEA